MKKVIKRDGSVQNYFPYKIEDAIRKAFDATGVTYDAHVFEEVIKQIQKIDTP